MITSKVLGQAHFDIWSSPLIMLIRMSVVMIRILRKTLCMFCHISYIGNTPG